MIRRRVEYVVCCDAPNCVYACAYNSDTAKDAEAEALKDGWVKLSARHWLCKSCAEKARLTPRP